MKSALVDGEQSYEYYKQERESMKFQKRLDNKIYTYKEADKPIPIKKSWGIGWYDNVKLIGWIAKGKMKIEEAAEHCKVRGYIQQYPDGGLKLWKNTMDFWENVKALPYTEPSWRTFDPEGEETSIVG